MLENYRTSIVEKEWLRPSEMDIVYCNGGKFKGHFFRVRSKPGYSQKSYELEQIDGDEFSSIKSTLGKNWFEVMLHPKSVVYIEEVSEELEMAGFKLIQVPEVGDPSPQWVLGWPIEDVNVLDDPITLAYNSSSGMYEGKHEDESLFRMYHTSPLVLLKELLKRMVERYRKDAERAYEEMVQYVEDQEAKMASLTCKVSFCEPAIELLDHLLKTGGNDGEV